MVRKRALIPAAEIVPTLSLTELCHISGACADWVFELVEEGILEPVGDAGPDWRFESTSISRILKVRRIQQDLRLNLPGVAVVLALADENTRLRRRLAQLGNAPHLAIWMPDEA